MNLQFLRISPSPADGTSTQQSKRWQPIWYTYMARFYARYVCFIVVFVACNLSHCVIRVENTHVNKRLR